MRIAFVSSMYGSTWGGSEELWGGAALRLRELGHEVFCGLIDWPGPAPQRDALRKAGCRVEVRTDVPGLKDRVLNRFRRTARRVHKQDPVPAALADFRPDLVVISQMFTDDGLEWMEFCRARGLAYVTIVQAASEYVWPGDELVPLEAHPLPHQIRMSNSLQVAALLRSQGIAADRRHWPDDAALIAAELPALLETYELVILSGGVSAGKFDYLPAALEQAGVHKLFHKVQQRPGKPFWFGIHPGGARVFALPGNPVSTFMCTLRYVIPWLQASLGQPGHAQYAILDNDLPFKPDLAYFPPVKLSYQPDGRCIASPVPGHGSGDLANLTDAEAFMELPCGKNIYLAGESYRIWKW